MIGPLRKYLPIKVAAIATSMLKHALSGQTGKQVTLKKNKSISIFDDC
jgi:hypothetical protein